MPKFEISVPITVEVWRVVEAEDEDEARDKAEAWDHGAMETVTGGRQPKDPEMRIAVTGEPDYDRTTVVQVPE